MENKIIDRLAELETELNNIAWHIRVCEESKTELCRLTVRHHLRAAKLAFDRFDNGE
jgi:hypothetical protein